MKIELELSEVEISRILHILRVGIEEEIAPGMGTCLEDYPEFKETYLKIKKALKS